MKTVYQLIEEERNRQNPKIRMLVTNNKYGEQMYFFNVSNFQEEPNNWYEFDCELDNKTLHVHTRLEITHIEEVR